MNIETKCKLIISFIIGVFLSQAQSSQTSQENYDKSVVTVFFVQHAEKDLDKTSIPLIPEGTERVSRLARTFSQFIS